MLLSDDIRRLVSFTPLLFLAVLWRAADAQFDSLSVSPGGSQFACALTTAGRVHCWGENQVGQLGIGRIGGYRSSPMRVALSRPVQSITVGVDYACALQDGRAFCWGTNEHGELADGSHVGERATPRLIKGSLRFRSLTAGYGVTCGIATSGDAYCWGIAESGQLGAGVRTDSVQGALRVSGNYRFRTLSAGSESTVCGVTLTNIAYCWGNLVRDTAGPMSALPVRVPGNLLFRDVRVGNGYACGLTTDSLAYCWGYDDKGNLGDGNSPSERFASLPTPVAGGVRFKSLSAAFRTACALEASGRAYCWGMNNDGQVGDGTTNDRSAPTPVGSDYAFREIRAGGSTSCGITVGGQIVCWGRGAHGELGNGETPQRSLRPVRVIDPSTRARD